MARKHSDIKELSNIQLKFLKQMIRVPYSTPNIGLFLELGLLPIVYIIDIRKITYLHHIITLPDEDQVKLLYFQQLCLPYEKNRANEVKSKMKEYNINYTHETLATMSRNKWKNNVKQIITQYAFQEMTTTASKMTKTKNIQYSQLETQPYLLKLDPKRQDKPSKFVWE